MYVNPSPSREKLMAYYPADYYSPAMLSHFQAFLDRLNRMNSFLLRKTRHWTSSSSNCSTKSVLEIGCANGNNLEPFLRAGWRVYGIEPNQRLADIAHSKGINVHVGFVDTADWNGMKFDAVVLHHVLEHEHDPRTMLDRAAKVLIDRGVLFVEVPTFETPSWALFGRYWGELEFPVHLTLLRKQQIIALLEGIGCFPIECRTRTLYGDVLRALSHRFPHTAEKRRMGRVLVTAFAIVIQIAFAVINTVLRRGEAFSVVAERNPEAESRTSPPSNLTSDPAGSEPYEGMKVVER